MRNVKLDRGNPLDLHEQAAGEIRRAITEGEANPGGTRSDRTSPLP